MNNIQEIFNSIQESGKVPEGWEPCKGKYVKENVKNKTLLKELRKKLPGKWNKIYRFGVDGTEIHYFEHGSGKVFNVEIKR